MTRPLQNAEASPLGHHSHRDVALLIRLHNSPLYPRGVPADDGGDDARAGRRRAVSAAVTPGRGVTAGSPHPAGSIATGTCRVWTWQRSPVTTTSPVHGR